MKSTAHHLLWTRHTWNKGYAQKLRRKLVFKIPDDVHKELHRVVAPIPPILEFEARKLYVSYEDMDLFETLDWLVENAPDEGFATAMAAQALFLRCHI